MHSNERTTVESAAASEKKTIFLHTPSTTSMIPNFHVAKGNSHHRLRQILSPQPKYLKKTSTHTACTYSLYTNPSMHMQLNVYALLRKKRHFTLQTNQDVGIKTAIKTTNQTSLKLDPYKNVFTSRRKVSGGSRILRGGAKRGSPPYPPYFHSVSSLVLFILNPFSIPCLLYTSDAADE